MHMITKKTVLNTNQSHTPDEYTRLNKVYLYKYPAACTRLSTHTHDVTVYSCKHCTVGDDRGFSSYNPDILGRQTGPNRLCFFPLHMSAADRSAAVVESTELIPLIGAPAASSDHRHHHHWRSGDDYQLLECWITWFEIVCLGTEWYKLFICFTLPPVFAHCRCWALTVTSSKFIVHSPQPQDMWP